MRAAPVALVVAAACAGVVAFMMSGPGQQFCSVHAFPTVHVLAVDAFTGSRLPDHVERYGRVIVSSGPYADTATLDARGAGSERYWGLFTVVVTVAGYREWVARDVVVWPTPCGARGPTLRPRLQRVGARRD